MPAKPFISPVDVHLSAANAPSESSSSDQKTSKPKPPKAKTERPKTKTKAKTKAKVAPVAEFVQPEFGTYRCQVCDFKMTVLPGVAKPEGGWRCPVDFSKLLWSSPSYDSVI